jgi:hypothetical protein
MTRHATDREVSTLMFLRDELLSFARDAKRLGSPELIANLPAMIGAARKTNRALVLRARALSKVR